VETRERRRGYGMYICSCCVSKSIEFSQMLQCVVLICCQDRHRRRGWCFTRRMYSDTSSSESDDEDTDSDTSHAPPSVRYGPWASVMAALGRS
jgi:hypothetical protein